MLVSRVSVRRHACRSTAASQRIGVGSELVRSCFRFGPFPPLALSWFLRFTLLVECLFIIVPVADKALTISQLPEAICLHLKRFNHNSMWGSKVSTRVSFPLEGLDLHPFCQSSMPPRRGASKRGSPSSSVAAAPASSATRGAHASGRASLLAGTVYDLVAIVEHMGTLQGILQSSSSGAICPVSR